MSDKEDDDSVLRRGARNATDLQRLKLEKLMKNVEKPAFIPDRSKIKNFPDAPEFVRNVMGSSAGAGSGEFHVYRHIRRREYTRQEYMNKLTTHEEQNKQHLEKIEINEQRAEQKTAKKRAKRQKRKQKLKAMKLSGGRKKVQESSTDSESEEEEEVVCASKIPDTNETFKNKKEPSEEALQLPTTEKEVVVCASKIPDTNETVKNKKEPTEEALQLSTTEETTEMQVESPKNQTNSERMDTTTSAENVEKDE